MTAGHRGVKIRVIGGQNKGGRLGEKEIEASIGRNDSKLSVNPVVLCFIPIFRGGLGHCSRGR